MGSNPPITAVPFSLAQPKVHIARYLDSVRPYVREHANRGTRYFLRSRRGGDHLSEEDWNPDYLPPTDSLASESALTLSTFLQSLSAPGASTSQLSDFAAKGSVLVDSLRPRLRGNTKMVDHERGKHPFGRGPSALRISPYPMRNNVKTGDVATGGDHYAGLGLHHQPQPPQPQRYSPDLGLHNRAFLPDASATPVAPLGIEYAAAHPHALSPRKGNVRSSGVSRTSPKRVSPLDVSRSLMCQDVVNAALARHSIARPGIFARGVTSQPIKVAGSQQQPSTGVPSYQMDERLLLGLMSNRAQEQAPPPLPSIQQTPHSHTTLGNFRMGLSTSWPLPSRPYQTQQQTPPATSSLPLEDPSLLDAMLPFYASRGRSGTQYQQLPTPPSALASYLPTDLSNLVSPIEPTSSPFDTFETMNSNVPQASEQRAVSADPPRWDSSPEAFDWGRPGSAPPSKLAQTPPNEAAHGRLPTPSFAQPGFQDLFTGSSDPAPINSGALAPLRQQPVKPPVNFAYTFRPNDYDFGLKWPGFPDASNWDLSPQTHHPAPYTYGYSPQAQVEPAMSLLPTSGPSGSSPFPSWHDAYSPQDSARDEAPVPQAFAAHAYL
ncbi:hypothetical protein CspHIS471_0105870 [Cutaneotrichosporon sp. HIS471]|nr:hypothetical protein CspHIS471_0105870 [Cutaneotrichosporon sp. HIS471]